MASVRTRLTAAYAAALAATLVVFGGALLYARTVTTENVVRRMASVRAELVVRVLRLASDELLDAARSVGLDVREVAIRATSQPIRPAPQPPPQAASRSAGPGPAAQEAFRAALETLADPAPTDPETGR